VKIGTIKLDWYNNEYVIARFEVFTAVTVKIAIFCDVALVRTDVWGNILPPSSSG
jgi:hypothetical protein